MTDFLTLLGKALQMACWKMPNVHVGIPQGCARDFAITPWQMLLGKPAGRISFVQEPDAALVSCLDLGILSVADIGCRCLDSGFWRRHIRLYCRGKSQCSFPRGDAPLRRPFVRMIRFISFLRPQSRFCLWPCPTPLLLRALGGVQKSKELFRALQAMKRPQSRSAAALVRQKGRKVRRPGSMITGEMILWPMQSILWPWTNCRPFFRPTGTGRRPWRKRLRSSWLASEIALIGWLHGLLENVADRGQIEKSRADGRFFALVFVLDAAKVFFPAKQWSGAAAIMRT